MLLPGNSREEVLANIREVLQLLKETQELSAPPQPVPGASRVVFMNLSLNP